MSDIRYFDAYSKPKEDYAEKTVTGGILSICALALILILGLYSFLETTQVQTVSELVVDKSRHERMQINVNITFPAIPCHLLNMDVMDVSGEQQNDLATQNVTKTRLDKFSVVIAQEKRREIEVKCGDCYGARATSASGCCNTCEEVRAAYMKEGWALSRVKDVQQCVNEGWADELDFDKGEGCILTAETTVNRVSGNFHFAPGKSYQQNNYHVHDFQSFQDRLGEFHFGHVITRLSFGLEFQGMSMPLDGYHKEATDGGPNFFQYYIKVVPTKVIYLNGTEFLTNQYAVTQYESRLEEKRVPGIFFNYDISPMLVIYAEKRKPFSAFFTELCGIIGGIYTLTALIDAIFYRAERHMKIKQQTGKLN